MADPTGFSVPLVDWFFQAKALRPALEAAAQRAAARTVWLKGLCNPLDPEPWRWQRSGLATAVVVKKAPGASVKARNGHIEAMLDSTNQLVMQREYRGVANPYTTVYAFSSPGAPDGRVRAVRYATDDYASVPPESVTELCLEGGRVVSVESYTNRSSWPSSGALTPADVERLKNVDPWQRDHRRVTFEWRGAEFSKADDGLIYDREGGALQRIRQDKRVLWERGKRKGWPLAV